jgi:hypothetical protein
MVVCGEGAMREHECAIIVWQRWQARLLGSGEHVNMTNGAMVGDGGRVVCGHSSRWPGWVGLI